MSQTVEKMRQQLLKTKSYPKVNLPALARRDSQFMQCWQADSGKVFVSMDFTSLEPSISAQYSKDFYYSWATYNGRGVLPYFDENGILRIDDIYLMVASVIPSSKAKVREFFLNPGNAEMWLTNPDAIKDKYLKDERKKAKPAVLGFSYGMGPRRFVNQSYDAGMVVTQADAKAMYDAFWDLFKDVRRFAKILEEYLKKHGAIINPFGYRLTPESHKGYNAFIQSSASGVLDMFTQIFLGLLPEAVFVTMVHDELIIQLDETLIDHGRKMKDEAVAELNRRLRYDIPMRAGYVVAKTFAEIK